MDENKKWAAGPGLGPRMAKVFNDARKEMSYVSCHLETRSGTKGGKEYSMVTLIYPPICRQPEKLATLQNAIGEKYGWTVSAKNYKAVVADMTAAAADLESTMPVEDKRTTPAEDDATVAEYRKADAERKAAEDKIKAETDAKVAAARAEKPYLVTFADEPKMSNQALGAKNIRAELARAFPGIKFQVTSEGFAGGDSIHVKWENGPTEGEVNAITGKYSHGDFDGMTDSYNYNRGWWHGHFGGTKYLFTERNTRDALDAVIRDMSASWNQESLESSRESIRHWSWEVVKKTALAPGRKIVGARYDREVDAWVAVLDNSATAAA